MHSKWIFGTGEPPRNEEQRDGERDMRTSRKPGKIVPYENDRYHGAAQPWQMYDPTFRSLHDR